MLGSLVEFIVVFKQHVTSEQISKYADEVKAAGAYSHPLLTYGTEAGLGTMTQVAK